MNSNSINNTKLNIPLPEYQNKIKISELMTATELRTYQHSQFMSELYRSKRKLLEKIGIETYINEDKNIYKKEKKFYQQKLEKAEIILNYLNK